MTQALPFALILGTVIWLVIQLNIWYYRIPKAERDRLDAESRNNMEDWW